MSDKKIIFTGIFVGLVLFVLSDYLSIDTGLAGVLIALVVGAFMGLAADSNSKKYAFFSIFTYNLIGWILELLFTSDGQKVLQCGDLGIFFLFSFLILIDTFFYSVIGVFGAFVATSMNSNKQGD